MLGRLLKMGLAEVTDRSRQEASKWLDRSGLGRRGSATFEVPGAGLSGGRSNGFFAGALETSTSTSVAGCAPNDTPRLIAAAEGILLGRFDLLGYRELDFGAPIDWRLDAVSGRRSPLVHWSLIDPTNAETVGDCKVVWELNRLQSFVTLAVAYRLTGDGRYAEAFVRLSREWIAANPAGLGINWASSLEAAFRIVSWSWALALFERSEFLSPSFRAEVSGVLDAHARHVECYLSRHSSPNTHLTGEALGLLYAGLALPRSEASARWRTLGQAVLDEQILVQVQEDGVYFEQSTAYERYTVEIYLHYLILARRNDWPVPGAVADRVQSMLDVLLALRRPDGSMPAIGDDDGGTLLPLCPRNPGDSRGVFAVAAALFERADYAWAAGGLQPEAVWLLGSQAGDAFAALQPTPPHEGSRSFADGGYVVMRSSWRRDAHHLILDVGPLGCPITGAHGHADLLSIQVSPFGEPGIVDPGTYAYGADPAFRDFFRGSRAHSTVTVDGESQAEPAGPFRWRARPAASLDRFVSTKEYDFACGSHGAYTRLPDPVTHRRRVAFIKKPGYWVVVDDLLGAARHRVDVGFQFARLNLKCLASGWVEAQAASGHRLFLRAYAGGPLGLRTAEGSTFPIEGWVSPNFGTRQPAPALIYSVAQRLPCRILTVLFPVSDASAMPPRIGPLFSADGAPSGVDFEETGQTVHLDDDFPRIEEREPCEA